MPAGKLDRASDIDGGAVGRDFVDVENCRWRSGNRARRVCNRNPAVHRKPNIAMLVRKDGLLTLDPFGAVESVFQAVLADIGIANGVSQQAVTPDAQNMIGR